MLHKTDINMDGRISSDELKTWIEKMRQNYAVKMAKERVTEYDSNNDGVVSMEEYFELVYGNDGNLGILSDYSCPIRDLEGAVKSVMQTNSLYV